MANPGAKFCKMRKAKKEVQNAKSEKRDTKSEKSDAITLPYTFCFSHFAIVFAYFTISIFCFCSMEGNVNPPHNHDNLIHI